MAFFPVAILRRHPGLNGKLFAGKRYNGKISTAFWIQSFLTTFKRNCGFFYKGRGLLNLSKQNDSKRQNVILKYELRSDCSDPYNQNLN